MLIQKNIYFCGVNQKRIELLTKSLNKMKKVYIVIAMLLVSAMAMAQVNTVGKLTVNKSALTPVAIQHTQAAKTVNDTMGLNTYVLPTATDQFYYDPYNFFAAPYILGGFVTSPDLITPQTFSAEGILWRVYQKNTPNASPSSKIYLSAGEWVIGTDTTIQYYTMDSITYNDVDTAAQWNTKMFAAPVAYTNCIRPFVMVDFSACMVAGDTVMGLLFDGAFVDMDCTVLVSGDAGATWDYYGLTTPSFFEAWVIAQNTTGIVGSDDYFCGMQLGQNYPNPSIDGNTTITYSLNKSVDNVQLVVIDANGKEVATVNDGSKLAGTYTIELNSQLSAGIYFYSLVADGQRLTKKMIVK